VVAVKSVLPALALLFSCGALVGACTPSPSSLCEHTTDVVEKQFGPDDPAHPEQSHERGVKRCLEIWSAKKKENASAYECYAKCASATKQVVELGACRPRCYPNEPKPRDEPENLEGIFWTDDAGTSDAGAARDARD
jgi:hypothetical protein